jgi:voltage-gated potassium channel
VIPVFVILRRFVRAMVAAWKSDAEFRVLVFLLISILVSGTTFYSFTEKWSVVDALYFSVTTLTTAGFGDLAPTTTLGKLFTVLYLFAGLAVIAGFIHVLTERRRAGNGEGQEDTPPSQESQDG